MKAILRALILLAQSDKGDVLMEYIVLTCSVIFPLVGFMMWSDVGLIGNPPTTAVFNPGAVTNNFGMVGDSFIQWYQSLVCGVGFPFP